jgi:hypothetical protein
MQGNFFFSEMAVLPCEIGTVGQGTVHRPQSRQRCTRSVCLKWPCRFKIPPTFWTVSWREMKLGYFITHLRISDNQCNGATHTHQQRKYSKPKNHGNPLLGQEGATSRQFFASRGHSRCCCLLRDAEETASCCSEQAERNGDARSLLTARATQELLQCWPIHHTVQTLINLRRCQHRDYIASDIKTIVELEWSGCDLIGVLSKHLSEGSEEKHEIPHTITGFFGRFHRPVF